MTLSPLFAQPPVIPLHALAAMAAFVLGAAQLALPKGTTLHRANGYVWVALMVAVALSSFWIHTIRTWGDWSPIHLLSILTLCNLPYAIWRARVGDFRGHRYAMIGLFVGGLVIAGGFALMPGRIMHAVVFGG
ncbi:MAG TPA: DUF2306 domain-containing protein [Alphaproteobacteria bacterium]|jgi:uncharacterized membrane protein